MIVEGSIRLPFSYAAGGTGSRFLIALRDERVIMGGRCEQCSLVLCPPRPFCPDCAGGVAHLVAVGPAGSIETWTEVPGKGVFGMILLDGADTALVHRLLGPGGSWAPGMRVVARFASQRIGSINDIEGFQPEQGGS